MTYFSDFGVIRVKINYRSFLNPKTIRKFTNSPQKIFMALVFVLTILFVKNYFASHTKLEAQVLKIIDGDTIEVLNSRGVFKVRLFGIDAPEIKQEFGEESRAFLASMISDKKVDIICKDEDQYGRILGIVEFEGKDINKIMVDSGHAWAYTHYTDLYAKDQTLAQDSKMGLWKGKKPLEPYKWRKQNQY